MEKDLHFIDQTRHVVHRAGSKFVQSGPPTLSPSYKSEKRYQWRHQFYDPAVSGSFDVSKRHIHRVQLLSTFLDLYLPKRHDKSIMSHFAYIAELPHVDLASPLLQVSIDTLCLAELGSLYEDERCLHESRARYVRALPMLANELAKPKSKQMRKDHILAAITILALCELFDAIARGNRSGKGWISHVNGAQQYIQANGPECIISDFGWLLFHNIRHSSLCMGFTNRKAVFFAEPKWLKVTEELAKQDPYVALYDIALQGPGILERFDTLSVADSIPADFAGLCRDICKHRTDLADWLQSHYVDKGKHLYSVVDVRDMQAFAHMCLDRTFQTVFLFDSVQICSQLQLYWISCLVLDFTLLATCRKFQKSQQLSILRLEDFTLRKEEEILRDLFVAGTNYCRSIPFCCEPDTASSGRIGTFLLRITQSYFEQGGHCREFEWCRAVRRMLASSLEVTPPSAQRDTTAEPKADAPTHAPWNMHHRCKSPVCNLRVECVAPAPLLLTGEYPNMGYTPKHISTEHIMIGTFSQNRPVELEEQVKTSIQGNSQTGGVEAKVGEEYTRMQAMYQKSTAFWMELPRPRPRLNGASALADERVLQPGDNAIVGSNDFESIRWTKDKNGTMPGCDVGRRSMTWKSSE